jgi:hypothetical protein
MRLSCRGYAIDDRIYICKIDHNYTMPKNRTPSKQGYGTCELHWGRARKPWKVVVFGSRPKAMESGRDSIGFRSEFGGGPGKDLPLQTRGPSNTRENPHPSLRAGTWSCGTEPLPSSGCIAGASCIRIGRRIDPAHPCPCPFPPSSSMPRARPPGRPPPTDRTRSGMRPWFDIGCRGNPGSTG